MEEALRNIQEVMNQVLKGMSGKADGFLLGGGTALSLVYFDHRKSFDLDFFMREFYERRIIDTIKGFSKFMEIEMPSIEKREVRDGATIIVCYVPVEENKALQVDDNKKSLKIDFIEDVYRDAGGNSPQIHGVPVMSKENIYLRKIYAAFGVVRTEDEIGMDRFLGGRKEAKDIFDLYYLSKTFMPLSKFMGIYCQLDKKVSAITWHRRYDRMSMRSEILDIITDSPPDCRAIESHFDFEIENIIKQIT